MKKYDILLGELSNRLRPLILNSTRDLMSVVTMYNTNPQMAHAEFIGTLNALYMLHIAEVPFDSEAFDSIHVEIRDAMKAIERLREKVIDLADNFQMENYTENLQKQGKKFEA